MTLVVRLGRSSRTLRLGITLCPYNGEEGLVERRVRGFWRREAWH
jgi:hypothetical protein